MIDLLAIKMAEETVVEETAIDRRESLWSSLISKPRPSASTLISWLNGSPKLLKPKGAAKQQDKAREERTCSL